MVDFLAFSALKVYQMVFPSQQDLFEEVAAITGSNHIVNNRSFDHNTAGSDRNTAGRISSSNHHNINCHSIAGSDRSKPIDRSRRSSHSGHIINC